MDGRDNTAIYLLEVKHNGSDYIYVLHFGLIWPHGIILLVLLWIISDKLQSGLDAPTEAVGPFKHCRILIHDDIVCF